MSTEAREQFYSLVHRHGVDEKRRLSIPAAWRPDNPEAVVTFYLVKWDKGGQPACLLALPPKAMDKLVERLDNLSLSDPDAESLARLLGGGTAKVTLDRAGRICLPEQIAQEAGITDSAVLVGMYTRFQIWNPERYAVVQATDQGNKEKAHKQI